jgi:hypothetical protein
VGPFDRTFVAPFDITKRNSIEHTELFTISKAECESKRIAKSFFIA